MGKLLFYLPDGSTREIALQRERVTIGRRADNDVCLPFPAVSGEHAAVVTILDDSFLEDLRSTNGTLVNGKAITKHFLRDRDEIDIGLHKLVYFSGEVTGALSAPFERADSDAVARTQGSQAAIDLDATLPPPHGDRSNPAQARSGTTFAGFPSMPSQGERIDTGPNFAKSETPRGRGEETQATPSDGATVEVLEGASAGSTFGVGREDLVIGRIGAQVAALRRTPDGIRLVPLEGETTPCINGAAIPDAGSALATGDELEIAGIKLRYRTAR